MLVKSQVKYIQSLSQKKFREEEEVFVAEGPKIINELLAASNIQLKHLYGTHEWLSSENKSLAHIDASCITVIDQKELERISFLSTPNEVLGIFAKPSFTKGRPTSNIRIMLDTIQDPGNLGTIVRCADWFGVDQIICSEECADVFAPKVVQSTMGSISRVQCVYTNLESFLDQHPRIPLYAALLEGRDLFALGKIKEGIILIGNESKGIRPSLLERNLHRITIPRKGSAESLNAAVATGIILSALT